MSDQLVLRLQQLKAEYEAGKKLLAELEGREASIRETLQRLSAAIQEIEEELAKAAPISKPGSQNNLSP